MKIIVQYNSEGIEMTLFHSLFELLASLDEDSICFSHEEGDTLVHTSVRKFIKDIEEYPVIPKQRVGIMIENTYSSILSLFAMAYQKKDIILFNPMEEEKTLQRQIQSSDTSLLLGRKEIIDRFLSYLREDIKNKDPKILFFTSGTTSSSKAVILTEEHLLASCYNGGSILPLKKDDVFLSILPLSHVFGFVCSLLWPLSFGARICLSRGMRHMMDDLSYFNPSVISLVPQMAGFYAKYNLFNQNLRLVLIGAGECNDDILKAIEKKGIQVSYGYGLTETSSGLALSTGPDPRRMTICPLEELRIALDGEILVSSDKILAEGYYKSNETLIDNEGFFHTGDLGKIEDGKLILLGRKKDIIVLDDGNKIYLPECEEELKSFLKEEDLALEGTYPLVLHIHTKMDRTDIEEKISLYNKDKINSKKIVQIVFEDNPIGKTLTMKVKRHLLHH